MQDEETRWGTAIEEAHIEAFYDGGEIRSVRLTNAMGQSVDMPKGVFDALVSEYLGVTSMDTASVVDFLDDASDETEDEDG